ncbi:MAG TPA: hypothetical protein VGO46_12115 [Gemmatimonadaceae bacterium]|jgi:hypothetical protein|nr:hypothetical protein [Gemmatimonadaceae bacterium]
MRKPSALRLLVTAAAVATVVACGEHAVPTALDSAAPGVSFSHHGPSPKGAPKPNGAPTPPPAPHVAKCHIPYDIYASVRVGPLGGRLDLGDNNTIVFPAGAILVDTTITAHVPKGDSARVQFTPEGLQFAVPAVVTLNYSACITPTASLAVVYLKADSVAEVEPSQSNPKTKTITAFINHFSSYAVAY